MDQHVLTILKFRLLNHVQILIPGPPRLQELTAGLPGTAGSPLTTNNNINVSPTVGTTYTVTASNTLGCTTTASSVAVAVNPVATVNAGGPDNVCQSSTPGPITLREPAWVEVQQQEHGQLPQAADP